ncbi:GDP-mannose 4,6-dehydratase [Candidatus Woesearchaeota archaeon]|nr:GDP-mannose 4,6-dehydratase [Candidatus Woesearchaeota archaeon]
MRGMSKKILVTGGAGFIGFYIVKALLDRGDSVVIVDNFNDYYNPKLKYARIKQIKGSKNLVVYRKDISKYKDMEKIFRKHKFDKICHMAAQAGVRYSLKDPIRYEIWNNLGTLNLLELCRKFGIKDFVYASSSSVYGGNKKIPFSEKDNVDSPISFYAATKKTNELYAHVYSHLYGLNCTGLRFFTVYGPFGRPDMALFNFVKRITEGKHIEVYNYGKMKRDFTYITDIVSGVLAAIDKPFSYEIFNLGNNKPVELNKFIKIIEKELGKKAKKKLMPIQPGDVPVTYANIDKAKKMLGYRPKTSIEEGVRKFIKWFKSENPPS